MFRGLSLAQTRLRIYADSTGKPILRRAIAPNSGSPTVSLFGASGLSQEHNPGDFLTATTRTGPQILVELPAIEFG